MEDESRCLFYIGTCYTLQGDTLTALEHVERIAPDAGEDFYGDLVVLYGKLLVESFSYREALGWLERHGEESSEGDVLQMVELLKGLAYRGLKDGENARIHLMKAYTLDPDSNAGRMAETLGNK